MDEAELDELVERAVDARDPDPAAVARGCRRRSPAPSGSTAARRGARSPRAGRRRCGGPAPGGCRARPRSRSRRVRGRGHAQIMIPIITRLLGCRACFRESFSLARPRSRRCRPSLAGCGSTASSGSGRERTVVAAFYPLAFAAEQIGGGHGRRREPDAGRRRAARPRADARRRPRRPRRRARPLPRRRLHAGARDGGARSASGRSVDLLAELRQQGGSGERPRTIPTSGSIRCATPRSCALIGAALGDEPARGRAGPQARRARRASTGGASPTASAARS